MAEFCGTWLWIDGVGSSIEALLAENEETEKLSREFDLWLDEYETRVSPAEPCADFDWASWHERGIALSHRLKSLIGEKYQVRFIYGYEEPEFFGGRPSLLIF